MSRSKHDHIRASVDDVHACYRLLLGREPDTAGLSAFTRLIGDKPLTPRELAGQFLQSKEFLHRSGTEPVEVALDGYVVNVRPSDQAIGLHVMRHKRWEPNVTAALVERLHPGSRFLDVGANIGYFTAMAAHVVGAGGHVDAVEPMDKNLQLICATVMRNAFNNVSVHPFAASDESGVVRMSTGHGSSNGEIVQGGPPGVSTFAQTRRLDELFSTSAPFDVIKFDIEGHELRAWNGARRILEVSRPIVFTEFHPYCLRRNAGIDPAEYAAVLFGYGVVTVLHLDGTRSPCPDSTNLMRLWEWEDCQLQTNGAAHLDLLVEPFARNSCAA